MILVRAWIRQALGASGAAVAVPAAMLGVLALLTLSGGLGRIGNIGQAFSGPRLPATVVPTPSSAREAARAPIGCSLRSSAVGLARARPHPARHPVEGRRAALRARPADPDGTAVPAGLAAGRAVAAGLPGARPPAEALAVPRPVRRIHRRHTTRRPGRASSDASRTPPRRLRVGCRARWGLPRRRRSRPSGPPPARWCRREHRCPFKPRVRWSPVSPR